MAIVLWLRNPCVAAACDACVTVLGELISEQLCQAAVVDTGLQLPASHHHVRQWLFAFLPQGFLWNTCAGATRDRSGINTWRQLSIHVQPPLSRMGWFWGPPICSLCTSDVLMDSVAYSGNPGTAGTYWPGATSCLLRVAPGWITSLQLQAVSVAGPQRKLWGQPHKDPTTWTWGRTLVTTLNRLL